MSLKRRTRQIKSSPKTNILVISDSGKLIFSRYGEEGSQVIAALFQTLRISTLHDERLGYGDVEHISTCSSEIIFRNFGHLTVVAIAYRGVNGEYDIETSEYLQLQMEFVYTGILFMLTDHVQYMAKHDFDVRQMLGSSGEMLRKLLNDMELPETMTPCYLGGIRVLSPIPSTVRQYANETLASFCSKQPSIVCAILSVKKRIFAILQPRKKMHHFLSADLNLFMELTDGQVSDASNEAWFPMCLPRVSSTGFLHCYQSILGSGLKITLISQEPTEEELSILREMAYDIGYQLGFESQNDDVLQVYDLKDSQVTCDDNYLWRRISSNLDQKGPKREFPNERRIHKYLLSSIKNALDPIQQEKLMNEYCDMANIQHFLFRYNIPIREFMHGCVCSCLPQVFGPSFHETSCDTESMSRYWKMYQRLSLIPKMGSVNLGTKPSSESFRSATTAIENIGINSNETLYYLEDENEVFVVYWKRNFELYGVMQNDLFSYDTALVLCSTLVDSLLHKKDDFFMR